MENKTQKGLAKQNVAALIEQAGKTGGGEEVLSE